MVARFVRKHTTLPWLFSLDYLHSVVFGVLKSIAGGQCSTHMLTPWSNGTLAFISCFISAGWEWIFIWLGFGTGIICDIHTGTCNIWKYGYLHGMSRYFPLWNQSYGLGEFNRLVLASLILLIPSMNEQWTWGVLVSTSMKKLGVGEWLAFDHYT
jgi:hypothetical protein